MKLLWVIFGYILLLVVIFAILFGIGFAGRVVNLWNYSFFAPKYENVRRDVFENTQSHVDWVNQDILKYSLEYKRAKTQDEKDALKFVIMHELAGFEKSKLDEDLRYFVNSL